MKLLTPQQMKSIDQIAIETLGIPGIVLMENAAIQVVKKAEDLLKEKACGNGSSHVVQSFGPHSDNGSSHVVQSCGSHSNNGSSHVVQSLGLHSITVIAGTGNNGGDAFAVARHLLGRGHWVSVFSMIPIEKHTGDALTNGLILKNMGLDIPLLEAEPDLARLAQALKQSDLVIDGLLGTGLNRDVEGFWAQVIDTINKHANTILSIDIASGVDGLTGQVRGACVKAHATVTFYLPKLGMAQYPGTFWIGELTVADIGIPYQLAEEIHTPELVEKDQIAALLPERPENGHKGTFGKILTVAGSWGMSGAAYLSASSAYRSGSGLVKMAIPQSCMETLSILVPEAVLVTLPEHQVHSCTNDGIIDLNGEDQGFLKALLGDADAVLVGPGLSCNEHTHALVKMLIEQCEKPMVFDGDGLNILAKDRTLLEKLRCEAVLTPHPAEMARLIGITTSEVQKDRISLARQFADEYGVTVVLKGTGTVIATNDGRVAINPTGNDGMGTAGAGDVLAGMVTSLLGQGLAPYEAALTGVYLHGLAGDFAAQEKGRTSLIASDIVAHIPDAFKHLRRY